MEKNNEKSLLIRMLDRIEKVGNRMPSPAMIFIILCGAVMVLSSLLSFIGVEALNPVDNTVVRVENLLTGQSIGRMIEEGVSNFSSFPALGIVLVVMLGIGLAEKSGYFEKLLTQIIEIAPGNIIIWVIILIGILGNVAGDAAPIVLPPLAAMAFLKLGYNPIAGAILGYATPLAAFAANIFLGMSDALVFAFTQPAAEMIDPNIELNVAMNYYFIIASTPVLMLVVYFVLQRYSLKRLGEYDPSSATMDISTEAEHITDREKNALKWANISLLITLAVIGLLTILPVPFGILRNQETGSFMSDSPLMNGIGIIMTIIFFVPGLVYGIKAGVIKNSHDFSEMMSSSMASMSGFIVIVFFSSQMMAYFNWSNMGTVIAIKGAELLSDTNGIVLIVGFIAVSAFIDFFIGSASAKWAILAPIFVPMFMLLGYHPAFTQMLYRIGDGFINPLTPMQAYIPLILAVMKRYDRRAGLGTLMSNVLPYSVAIAIAWTLLIIVWYLIGLPLGPNSPVYLN